VGRGAGPGAQDRHLENFLQDLIFNVTGMGVAGGGGGPQGLQFHLVPGNQIHGNPGDYAWGRGGLDAIITQLLNQVEGTGPPPMAEESIKELPDVKVDSVILEKNPNCSVCWEDFKLEESVKQLECSHCFHKDCIVPWLELHGTCPVCRKVLNGEGESVEGSDQETDQPIQTNQDNLASHASTLLQNALGGHTFGSSLLSSFLGGGGTRTSQPGRGSRDTFSSQSSASTPSSSQTMQQTSSSNNAATSSTGSGSASTSSTVNPTTTGQSATRSVVDASSSEDETPATRRQRLNSDFVDFDLE